MKRFLLICLGALTVIIGTLAILEYVVRQQPNIYQYKNDYMVENGAKIETLVLGSSHTFYGIQPAYFEQTQGFSLANMTQGLKYDDFLLQKYGPYCPHLKTVIIPISYFSLFSGDACGNEWWKEIRYKIYMDAPFHRSFSKYNFLFCHYTTFKRGLLHALKKPLKQAAGQVEDLGYDSFGAGTQYTLANKNPNWDAPGAGKQGARNHAWGKLINKDTNCGYLNNMLTYCQERDIRVILLTTPVWHSYSDAVDPKRAHIIQTTIDSILVAHPGVTYHNYLRDARFTEDDFFDQDHLSNIGAEKFTKILVEEFGL